MVSIGAPKVAAFLSKPSPKVLTEKEQIEKDAAEDRKKRVEILMSYQEKIDAIQKLETEMAMAKQAAIVASPAMFGLGGSPHLNFGAGGVAGLAQRGGPELASTQARLAAWLLQNNPQAANMSEERRHLMLQYNQMEQYMRAVMGENAALQEENHHLERTIRQTSRRPFDPYEDDGGADPLYAEERRHAAAVAAAAARRGGYGHHGGYGRGAPVRDPYADPYADPYRHARGGMSPEFARAREAEQFYGRRY